MTLRPCILAALLCLGLALTVTAGDAGHESPFSAGAGSRALGMGGGFTSIADDASAVFYNPAGLPWLRQQEVGFMHMTLFEGTVYDYASWAYPHLILGGFGVGFMRIGAGDIVRRTDFVDEGAFGYSQSQIMFSYGRPVYRGMSFGATLKVLNQSIDDLSDWGIGLDLGAQFIFRRHFSLGLIARDLVQAELRLKEKGEYVPTSIAGGVALRDYPLAATLDLSSTLELEKTDERSVKVHTGAEVVIDRTYAVRAGYDRDNFAVGVGYVYHRFSFDYTYKFLDYIDDSHRFSLSIRLGSSVEDQRLQREMEEARKGSVLLEDERRRQLTFFRDKADSFYAAQGFDSALTYYQRALAFDEGNPAIVQNIGAIQDSLEARRQAQASTAEAGQEQARVVDGYLAQARAFVEKRYYPAARDMLGLVFEIDSTNAEARALQAGIDAAVRSEIATATGEGRKAESVGDFGRAIEAYVRVLELDPGNREIQAAREGVARKLDLAKQLNQAVALYNDGDWKEAAVRFRSVLAADSTNAVALEYLRKMEAQSPAPATLEDLQQDKDVWQWYLEGLRFMRNKQYQEAIEVWQKVLQVYPNNPNTLDNIQQARLRMKSEQGR